MVDTEQIAPPDPDRDVDQPGGGDVWRWIVGILAVAFFVGAAGYLVGVRNSQESKALNAVDIGFLIDMTAHHDQAVEMALLELDNGEDPVAKGFAQEVILSQRREIGIMKTLLDIDGVSLPEFDPARTTMVWMDMATPLADMPGIASEQDMAALAEARGAEADELFLSLMREHHLGGIHMGEYVAEHGSSQLVRDLGARMARNQAIEVEEYTALMVKLGFE